jgi:protein-tyrosine-phosphatase
VTAAPTRVLFVCTGNSARSIMAEALLNHHGQGRFRAWSAGSHPKGAVHPLALRVLERVGLPTSGLRSKSWDEFAGERAPRLDQVFTVCGNAAAEVCPVFPGHPTTGHWPIEDPAAVEGDEATRLTAFERAFADLEARVKALIAAPVASGTP